MKIRNLEEYIQSFCPEATLSAVGRDDEPFLAYTYGNGSSNYLESVIGYDAAFASNAEQQLFYEFVQNALDANADSLFFYANEEFLIVVNNGKPFNTNQGKTNELREGELYQFLTRNKSAKRGDANMMGQYGQGSKLLYTLIAPVDTKVKTEKLLTQVLKDEKKGPYLISWKGRLQLSYLWDLSHQTAPIWERGQFDDEENVLLAKILMSYYPVTPGVDDSLFSTQEAIQAISAFNDLVDPKSNMQALGKQGTALIIPLGKGKYERITNKKNLEDVKIRLGIFSALTQTKANNQGKSVRHICVLGPEEIEQFQAQSVLVNVPMDNGEKREYHFIFSPDFSKAGSANFFKYLPIIDTSFQLGFVIDSDSFEVDSSRQRISDKEKTKEQLAEAFKVLIEEIKKIQIQDAEKFAVIYQSLLATRVHNFTTNDPKFYIKEAFEAAFKPFFEQNIRTCIGTYEPKDRVRTNTKLSFIPLQQIGISDCQWIDPEAEKGLKTCMDITVDLLTLPDLLQKADEDQLATYIKGLKHIDYVHFQDAIQPFKEEISTYALFRTNEGNLYSFDELESEDNVYYAIEPNMPFGDCECVESLIPTNEDQYYKLLYNKIKANLPFFRENDSHKADAVNLLNWIVQKYPVLLERIKQEIDLLQNGHNEYAPFSRLFATRPQGTLLFDQHCVQGYVPELCQSWLISPDKPMEMLSFVNCEWNNLTNPQLERWGGDNTTHYIRDLQQVWNSVPEEKRKNALSWTLSLDEQGIPCKEKRPYLRGFNKLTSGEYEHLNSSLNAHLLPYQYAAALSKPPFNVGERSVEDLLKDSVEVDKSALATILKISPRFLDSYYILEQPDEHFQIFKDFPVHNYVDDLDSALQEELKEVGYYSIPFAVKQLLPQEVVKNYCLTSNDDWLINALESVDNILLLFPLVKKANNDVKTAFFENLPILDICQPLRETDLEWQVIDFSIHNQEYVREIRNRIHYHRDSVPYSRIKDTLTVGKNEYKVYELDPKYRDQNQKIDAFLQCLPSDEARSAFEAAYLTKKTVDAENIFDTLRGNNVALEQLRFFIDYALANKKSSFYRIGLKEKIDRIEALNMMAEYKLEGFDQYWNMGVRYLDDKIYASTDLLLEDECLPDDIQHWIDQDPKHRIELFRELKNGEERKDILFRRHWKDQESLSEKSCKELLDDSYVDKAFEWIRENANDCVYGSPRYEAMLYFIQNAKDGFPSLRYRDVIKESEQVKVRFTVEMRMDEAFLPAEAFETTNLPQSKRLYSYFQENAIYLIPSEKYFYQQRLEGDLLTIKTAAVGDKFPEWDDQIYQSWKQTIEKGKKITIRICQQPVATNFSLVQVEDGKRVFSEKVADGEYGYEEGKWVVVQQPNASHLSVLQTLANHIEEMPFFHALFVSLQNYYIDQLESSKKAIEASQKELRKLNLTTEELRILEDENNPVRQAMDEMMTDERSSKMREDINYLGELIYQQYLNKKGAKYKYVAPDGEQSYDFEIIEESGKSIYVDVRTTLYALEDQTAPFYLRCAQNVFMQQHPKADYRVVRISLKDLNLKQSLEDITNLHGKEADPYTNPHLKNGLEKMVQNYWKYRTLQNFEANSPEFGVQITKIS